jgi:hypothetical protein
MSAVAEGRFDDAWEQRAALQTPDALVTWDFRPDSERPLGSRQFLTRDEVEVEIGMSVMFAQPGSVLPNPTLSSWATMKWLTVTSA